MKKILVTTDFSSHSKSAIKFAIKLAQHNTYELTFLHVQEVLRPTIWTDKVFQEFEKEELEKTTIRVREFVESVARENDDLPSSIKYAVTNSATASTGIIDYATHNNFDFICTSTHGEGKFQLILGSTATKLIKKSNTPLITVPADYIANETKSVLYATDFSNVQADMKVVTEFAEAIKADLGLLYFQVPGDPNIDPELMKQTLNNLSDYPVKIHLKDAKFETPLVESIQKAILEIKPSMLVMFTDQEKGFLENILFPSFTKEYMSKTGIPLIIFKKKSK